MTEVKYKSIKDWNADEKPRERLISNGASTLSNAEILAILLGSGTKNLSAVDLARKVVELRGDLSELAACDYAEFKQVKGIGDAKAVTLAAAFELAKRVEIRPFDKLPAIKTSRDVANYLTPKMAFLKKEIFVALLLNSSNRIIREAKISEGSLNSSIVHPREAFRPAIVESAAAVIFAHNHPSGNPEPSEQDKRLTKQLSEAGKILGVKVLDHVIIAGDNHTALADYGLV